MSLQSSLPASGDVGTLRRPRWTLFACAVLVAAALAAYGNSFSGPFIFDDKPGIVDNAALRKLWPIGPALAGPRPVVNLTLAVNYSFGGLSVTGYHVANLVIHVLAALTLFGILRRTFLSEPLRKGFGEAASGLALVTALLWMLHPLQTESVTYIVQRGESLMGLLYLLTLYCAIRSFSSPHPGRWQTAAILACALGMGAKPVMVTAPILVLLYDRLFVSHSLRGALRRSRALYIGLSGTWLVLGFLLLRNPSSPSPSAGFGMEYLTPRRYALTQFGVILHYLRLSFWPEKLCLDYFWPAARTLRQVLPAAIAVAILVAATLWALLRASPWGFLGAWFFLILAPTSSVMPLTDVCFEHRMYLSLAAVAAAAILGGCWLADRLARLCGVTSEKARRRLAARTVIAGVLCAAALAGARTFARNQDYRTAISIWEDTVRNRPDNIRALNTLGVSYNSAGRTDAAIACFDKAVKLLPSYAGSYNNRGNVYTHVGRYAEAVSDFDKAVAIVPDFADAYSNRAIAYSQMGRSDLALHDYDKAIELNPDYALVYFNRGNTYADCGRFAEAVRDYDKAVKLDPDFAEAYGGRAVAYGRLGREKAALNDYDRAIALKPAYAAAHFNRGGAYVRAGRLAEALGDFDKAISLLPQEPAAYTRRAMTHARMGRFDLALRDYDRAIELKPNDAEAYVNRGNANADAGHLAEAICDFDKAAALSPKDPRTYNDRGSVYRHMGQLESAFRDYDRAIELKPDYAEAYFNRGNACATINRFAEAAEDYEKAVSLKRNFAPPYKNLATVCFRMKQYDRARSAAQMYQKLGGQLSPEFLRNLAEATGRTE